MGYEVEIVRSVQQSNGYGSTSPARVLRLDVPDAIVNKLIATIASMCASDVAVPAVEPVVESGQG